MKTVNFAAGKEVGTGDEIDYVPNADVISIETLVNIMVNKGICTADELFMIEARVQQITQKNSQNNFVPIKNHYQRGRFPGLKKTMSKNRWLRRLGTALFGWKWKKVKKHGSLQ